MPVRLDRSRAALIAAVVAAAIVAAVISTRRPSTRITPVAPSDGALVVAAAGDAALVSGLAGHDADLRPIAALLHGASVALANFELTLLATPPPATTDDDARWPPASPDAGRALRALGIAAVSLANNHVADYGLDGLEETGRRLDEAQVVHAGTGADLASARAAAVVAAPAGRVAIVAAATSHAAIARAAPGRGDIKGRPGLSPLRYDRVATVDRATFTTLRQTAAALAQAGAPATIGDDTLTLFGTTIRLGDRNHVELVANADDMAEIAGAIRRARPDADVVVFSLHAHEPGNREDAVTGLLRDAAHAAVDAGADMVVGHGPHRLRGIEIYKGRPILYSLGNFIFQAATLQAEAADVFEDASQNLLAGTTSGADAGPPVLDFSEDVWWESVIAAARFERGRFVRLDLHPIDLGVGRPREARGIPRLAAPDRARQILSRLQQLSSPFGTTIEVRDTLGVIAAPPPPAPPAPASSTPR